jgi:hypothetical protein
MLLLLVAGVRGVQQRLQALELGVLAAHGGAEVLDNVGLIERGGGARGLEVVCVRAQREREVQII